MHPDKFGLFKKKKKIVECSGSRFDKLEPYLNTCSKKKKKGMLLMATSVNEMYRAE